MDQLKAWLNQNIDSIEGEPFKGVVRIDEAIEETLGDSPVVVVSEIRRVNLSLVTNKGEKRKIKAISKTEPTKSVGKDFANACAAFTTERRMYAEVLKSMGRLILEKGDKEFLWAQCYCCDDNRLLFQDLGELGYRIVPTYKFLDVDHMLLTMEALGKYHALSIILKERSLLDTSHFVKPYYVRRIPFIDTMYINMIESLSQTMKDNWGLEWSSVADRLVRYLEKPGEALYNAWESSRGKWDVLCHGDFTMRNMLFHYQDKQPDKPDGVKFVDFQLCHYSNLANDLITLLYGSIKPQLRDENMKDILNSYLVSLKSTCAAYGYKGALPTLKDIEKSLMDLSPVRVAVSAFCMPMNIASAKGNLQEKAVQYFEVHNSRESTADQQKEALAQLNFGDLELQAIMKYEITKWLEEKVF